MSVVVNINNFGLYFKKHLPEFVYDHIMSELLFCLACRPVEFLNLGSSNFDVGSYSITFTQAKGGLVTTRSIPQEVYEASKIMFSTFGNPKTYYGSYSTLSNYITRVSEFKLSVNNRMDKLYPFRYCACAELLFSKAPIPDVYSFFNHLHQSNTDYYINQAVLINEQIPN